MLAGRCGVQRVMRIVVPLRPITRGFTRVQVVRGVVVVLEHQVDPPLASGPGVRRRGDLVQDVHWRVVADRVHGVVAQAVEAIFLEPVERVVNEEVAHRPAVLAVEIDRLTPQRVMAVGKERRRVGVKIVALGPEVVVHDVEKDHQAVAVHGFDQTLQIVGSAVARIGREGEHAVVAPVATPRKIGDRHQLDRGHAEIRQIGQALDRRAKGTSGRESADVQLVDDRLVPRPAGPVAIVPFEHRGIDHFARAVRIVGIRARRRVGYFETIVDAIAIAAAGPCGRRDDLEKAAFGPRHRKPLGRSALRSLEDQIDAARRRSPEAKAHTAIGAHFRTEGHRVRVLHGVRNCISSATDRP